MRLFALTGSIGSGKSAVSHILNQAGVTIIDADQLAREVVAKGSKGLEQIQSHFGQSVLSADGSLDRARMAELVFQNRAELDKLESITHPLISDLFNKKLVELKASLNTDALIVDVIPLLFESKLTYPKFEQVLVVSAPKKVCIERIIKRDKISHELAEKKFNSQLAPEEKVRLADVVFDNSKDLDDLKSQVLKWLYGCAPQLRR